MINKSKQNKGFTLVELLVAIGLFTLVVSMSIGALVVIFDANKKAQSSKTVMDNLNFSIENMTRTIRFGGTYHCDVPTANSNLFSSPANCSDGKGLIAVNFNGSTIVYRWNGTESDPIQRSDDGGSTYTDITSPETVIQHAEFYVFGAESDTDGVQPYVLAVIKGYVGSRPTNQTTFLIETLMSQRNLSI